MMTNNAAAAADEYRSNIGHDFTLADAYDAEYLDTDETAERTEETAPLVSPSVLYYRKCERVGAFVI